MNMRKPARHDDGYRFAHSSGVALCRCCWRFPWTAARSRCSDAWAMALQSDGTLAAAHSERQAAEADHSAALRQRWPALDLERHLHPVRACPEFRHIATPAGQLQAPILGARRLRHGGRGSFGTRSGHRAGSAARSGPRRRRTRRRRAGGAQHRRSQARGRRVVCRGIPRPQGAASGRVERREPQGPCR